MNDFADGLSPRSRRPSPARLQRRRLAIDLALGVVIAVVLLVALGGLGVVAWFGVPILLIGLLSFALERGLQRRRRRRG